MVAAQPVTLPTARDTEPRRLRVITDVVSFLVTADQVNGSYSIFETETQPDGGVPPHYQPLEDESFYVLEGAYEFLAGDERVVVGPGQSVAVPRGTVHGYRNIGTEPARMIIMVAPGGIHERFFSEVGVPADAPAGPIDFGRLAEAAERAQIIMLPPSD